MRDVRDLQDDVREGLDSVRCSLDVIDTTMTDLIPDVVRAIRSIGHAISGDAMPYTTPEGGRVGDLTEAMIMCGLGLRAIASAITEHTEFLREQAEGES